MQIKALTKVVQKHYYLPYMYRISTVYVPYMYRISTVYVPYIYRISTVYSPSETVLWQCMTSPSPSRGGDVQSEDESNA